MRIVAGLVGLALAVVATGACEEPHAKGDDAVGCMALLAIQSAAVSEGAAEGDVAALGAAGAAWRTLAEQKYTTDELAQYLASSVAVFEQTPVDELALVSLACAAHAPMA